MKTIVKDECVKFYEAARPLYLENDTSEIGLGFKLLQVRDGINSGNNEIPDNTKLLPTTLAGKGLSSVEQHYYNIECKEQGILYGLEKCHYYCFARDVGVITEEKPLVATQICGSAITAATMQPSMNVPV